MVPFSVKVPSPFPSAIAMVPGAVANGDVWYAIAVKSAMERDVRCAMVVGRAKVADALKLPLPSPRKATSCPFQDPGELPEGSPGAVAKAMSG